MKKFRFEDEAEDVDILAEDDLDLVEDEEDVEQVNEVRYIDPENVDNYDPNEIEEVTTSSGEKRYKRKTGAQTAKVDKKDGEQQFNYDDAKQELAKEIQKSDEDEWYTREKNKHYAALAKFARDGKAFYNWTKSKLASGKYPHYDDFMRSSGIEDEMNKANLTKKQRSDIINRFSTRALGYYNDYKDYGKI